MLSDVFKMFFFFILLKKIAEFSHTGLLLCGKHLPVFLSIVLLLVFKKIWLKRQF